MKYDIDRKFTFDFEATESESRFLTGEIYHAKKTLTGGGTFTPIARFFCWRPLHPEGFNAHWHVHCYIRQHELSPDPEWLGKELIRVLQSKEICDEPIWVSWFDAKELNGRAYGEVFERD